MQPGSMTVYRLTDTDQSIYRLVFTSGSPYNSPRFKDRYVDAWTMDDINYWQSYVKENFEDMGNGYYKIPNSGIFFRELKRNKPKYGLRHYINEMPGLTKFLLIGILIIGGVTLYQSVFHPKTSETIEHHQ